MGKIGGDSDLSERGRKFGNALAEYIKEQKIPKVSLFFKKFMSVKHFFW